MNLKQLNDKIVIVQTFLKYSEKSIIILEVNHDFLINEIKSHISNAFWCDISQYNNYLSALQDCVDKNVVIYGFWDKYNSIEDVATEINYSRDIYNNLNKNIIIILPSCIVDHIMLYAISLWSCVTLHESFTLDFYSPSKFVSLCNNSVLIRNKKGLQKNDEVHVVKTLLCDKLECKKNDSTSCLNCLVTGNSAPCYSQHKSNSLSVQMWMSRILDIGDFYLENNFTTESFLYYNLVLDIADKHRNKMYRSLANLSLAKWNVVYDQLELAIVNYQLAMTNEPDLSKKNKIYNDYSITMFHLEHPPKTTYEYFKKAELFFSEIDDNNTVAIIQYNIAIYYYNIGNNKCAMDYINKSLEKKNISKKTKIQNMILKCFLRICNGEWDDQTHTMLEELRRSPVFGFLDYVNLYYEQQFLDALYCFSKGKILSALKTTSKILAQIKQNKTTLLHLYFPFYYLYLHACIFSDQPTLLQNELKKLTQKSNPYLTIKEQNKCKKLLEGIHPY